jgi:hypothetical protein
MIHSEGFAKKTVSLNVAVIDNTRTICESQEGISRWK